MLSKSNNEKFLLVTYDSFYDLFLYVCVVFTVYFILLED